jgi:diguanylate cyclase (GGDEF)-like protein
LNLKDKALSRISLKIVSIIILSVLFSAGSIAVLSTIKGSQIIEKESYDKFKFISRSSANEFSLQLTGIENIVHTIRSSVVSNFDEEAFTDNINYRDEYVSEAGIMLQDIGQKNDHIQGIYLVVNPELSSAVYESWYINDGSGNFIYQNPEDISTFYSENEDMKWYYDPIRMGRGVWSLPYTDVTIGVEMISYTEPLFSEGHLIAVAGIDISFTEIQRKIEHIDFYETGYGVLVDEEYNIIVHPDMDVGMNLRTFDDGSLLSVVEAIEQQDSDVLNYIYKGTDKILGFSKLSNDWIFIAAASHNEINRPVANLRHYIALIVLITVLLAIAGGLKMSSSITRQLNNLHELTENIGNGNFDVSVEMGTKDEFSKLASSFQNMSRKIELSQNELIEVNKSMEIMAFHDPLTHLPNRRSGLDRLSSVLESHQENQDLCGIMSIDLDHFKEVNDSLGHDAGDQLLLHITEKMSHQIDNNDMLCRMGGDEFLLIFNNVPSLGLVKAMAVRLLQTGSATLRIKSKKVSISCSIGIALIDRDYPDLKEILERADKALYAVKRNGRNNYMFFTEDL